MKKNYSIIKIIFTNVLIVSVCIILAESLFGYWFDKDNFGPYMREHRMKNQPIVWKQKDEIIKYNYIKNYYGFRGDDIEPSKIQAIIMGGSTIDEKFKPEKYTITGFLNSNLKEKNNSIQIVNAGVWGQSTKGMVHGFENWLLKIKKFRPKFILIYTGINELEAESIDDKNAIYEAQLLNSNKYEAFVDNIKSRSFIYDQLSIFRYKILSKNKNFVKYDGKVDEKYKKNFNFINYDQAKQVAKKNENRTKNYLKRIDQIYSYSKKLGSKPIFITNLSAQGHIEDVYLFNTALIDHCLIKNYLCVDLAKKLNGNINYWYDGTHTTKEGSKAIADLIMPELLAYFNN
jgi:lysophospholipase L1-like esterase